MGTTEATVSVPTTTTTEATVTTPTTTTTEATVSVPTTTTTEAMVSVPVTKETTKVAVPTKVQHLLDMGFALPVETLKNVLSAANDDVGAALTALVGCE